MATATLSAKSQIVIPAEIRKKLDIRAGDRLIIETENDQVIIRKAPISDVTALEKYVSPIWCSYADELEKARDEWNDR